MRLKRVSSNTTETEGESSPDSAARVSLKSPKVLESSLNVLPQLKDEPVTDPAFPSS